MENAEGRRDIVPMPEGMTAEEIEEKRATLTAMFEALSEKLGMAQAKPNRAQRRAMANNKKNPSGVPVRTTTPVSKDKKYR